jgi:polygalacturonase
MNTAAISRAFDSCVGLGGGYVEVPPGLFLTGKISLRSGCYLLLAKHGILQATTSASEYGDNKNFWYVVVGKDIANSGVIALAPHATSGGGGLRGAFGGEVRGTMWQSIASYDPKTNSFAKKEPGSEIGNLFFQDSVNISVIGVRITESGFWAQTFRRCSNVLEERVSVEGSVQWGTGDGLDVESGYNLTFRDSTFKTGDDCMAFRSGSFLQLSPPWPPGPISPVQHVRISNVTLTSSSSAIKFEASTISGRNDVGDIFDVLVDGVKIVDTNRGIGIWQRSGDRNGSNTSGHGSIRDIVIRNVESTTRFDSKPQFWGSGEPFVITVLPLGGNCCVGVHNITVQNSTFVAENSALLSSLGSKYGDPNPPSVSGIRLENVSITIKKSGNASRPQRDYRPIWDQDQSGAPVPATLPAPVDGIVVENIAGITIVGGGVDFSPTTGPGKQPFWGMACLNITGQSHVQIQGGEGKWSCQNSTRQGTDAEIKVVKV